MLGLQGRGLAEGGHIGPQVIEPDLFGIALVGSATGEEQHIGLDTLGIENAGGKTENRMQITLIHQVNTDALTVTVSEEDIIRQHHSSTCFAVGLQAAVDMLQEVQLLIACRECKVRRVLCQYDDSLVFCDCPCQAV